MKSKYTCRNCGAGQDRKHVEAKVKAGFGLRHLACRECGSHEVQDEMARLGDAELASETVTREEWNRAIELRERMRGNLKR